MTLSRVQEAIKILKSNAEDFYFEEKPKPRKNAKGRSKKAAVRKAR
jgi:hypothetical protein